MGAYNVRTHCMRFVLLVLLSFLWIKKVFWKGTVRRKGRKKSEKREKEKNGKGWGLIPPLAPSGSGSIYRWPIVADRLNHVHARAPPSTSSL